MSLLKSTLKVIAPKLPNIRFVVPSDRSVIVGVEQEYELYVDDAHINENDIIEVDYKPVPQEGYAEEISVSGAVKKYGISRRRLYRLCKSNSIGGYKNHIGHWCIDEESLKQYLRNSD